MRVAFIIPAIDAMGPNIFTYNLIESLLNMPNFYCEVFHFDRGNKSIKQLSFPVKTIKLSFNKKYDFTGFDILHTTMPVPDLYVAKYKLYKKFICVTSMHCFMEEDLYQRKGGIKGWIELQMWKYALNKFSNVIVSSSAMKDYYMKNISCNQKYEIIPYGIPLLTITSCEKNIIDKIMKLKSSFKIICGCGSLIKRKGFYQLIKYLSHNKNAAVVLIGKGNRECELKKLARTLHVEKRVLFLGFLKDSYNYYPYMDAYCMSSNSEGFGLAMLEAMQMGIPIICSNLDIYKDYFNGDDVGLFKFDNQISFNNATDKVLNNKEYYSNSSRHLYKTFFNLDSLGNRHYAYYNDLITHIKCL